MPETEIAHNSKRTKFFAVSGPLLFILSVFIPSPDPYYPHLLQMTGITAWVALWWLTEATHIAVTSFIPFLLLPATGIADIKVIAAQYMDPILFLFIGGFILAFAIEKWGLHRRLALGILASTGKTHASILLGIMTATYLTSMWISNTATVMMLISAVLAVIYHLKSSIPSEEDHRKIASALLIGLAYSSSIGGMATLVGTPTNMIFYRVYQEHYGLQHPINFIDWMAFAFPISVLLLIFTFLIIWFGFIRKTGTYSSGYALFKKEKSELGPWNADEKKVGILFLLTAILWFTRADLEIGTYHIRGWASLFPYPAQITDSTVAIAIAVLLFLLPSTTEKGRTLMSWQEASRLPYEIILLFGSGFALAKGFETSGLSNWLAQHLHHFKSIPLPLLVLLICVLVTVISEFASNVASIQLVLPILISLQLSFNCNPETMMVPSALSASLGFMLPIATAPNTIVFSSGYIKVREMAIAGIAVDIIGILIITLFSSVFL